MKPIKNGSAVLVAGLIIFGLGIATCAIAKSLDVITVNQTTRNWNAKECVNNRCKSFTLNTTPVSKLFTEYGSSTATLKAQFTEVSTPTVPVTCGKSFNVNVSTTVYVAVSQSSATYSCNVLVP
jgi:hypothetical protein